MKDAEDCRTRISALEAEKRKAEERIIELEERAVDQTASLTLQVSASAKRNRELEIAMKASEAEKDLALQRLHHKEAELLKAAQRLRSMQDEAETSKAQIRA